MKDVIIKDCGHTVGAGIVTINNKKFISLIINLTIYNII